MIITPDEYILHDDYAELIIYSPKHGRITSKIDLEEVEKCKVFKWGITRAKGKLDYYWHTYIESQKANTMLHRFIMNAKKGEIVDHINHDTLDNRKSNLRICSPTENKQNSALYISNTSGHKGVTWNKRANNWMAYIYLKTKFKNLGYFNCFKDAVIAREEAEAKYFGEFSETEEAKRNIIDNEIIRKIV